MAKYALVRWLVRQLFPSDLDLHAYRVLLVAPTGHGPEEVTTLTENDIEFFPDGVRLRLAKHRVGLLRQRTFRDSPPSEDSVEFVDRPRREVGAIVARLWDLTDNIRQRSGDREGRLFMTATVSPDFQLHFDRR